MPDFVRSARPATGILCLIVICCAMASAGCASWFGREPAHQNQIVNYYNKLAADVATLEPKIESQASTPSLGEERELTPPKPGNRWLLTLAEAIQLALENNKIIRQNSMFLSPNNPILRNPDGVPSVYDSLIQNKGVLFGARGTDAALSDFDPRLSVNLKSGNDVTVDNLNPGVLLNQVPPGNLLNNNYTQVQSRIDQQLLGGGVFSITQNWNYGLSNQPDQLYNSAYTGLLGAEFRQPMWAGSGRTYTSIAGPVSQRARGFSNVSQGIVIAHINKKLSEIDLQENLQNLVRDVGDVYWDLYQNYQDYEAEQEMAQGAYELWKLINRRKLLESDIDVAQAEAAYHEAKAREQTALSNLYLTESLLRRLISMPVEDSRLIYPMDVPHEEELRLNRPMCLYEALVNRLELSRQKTNIHSLQLQLCAAKKLVAPRLDFVSGYALNGFGNNFISANSEPFSSAVGNLYSARETSWNAGFEYSIPLWLRQEKSQVHQLEFKLLKARAALDTQEAEIVHELKSVLIKIKRAFTTSRTNLLRMQAANRQVQAARKITEGGYKNGDVYLRALTSFTQAKVAYYRSVSEYNKSLRDLLFRMGRLLPADGVSVLGTDGLPVLSSGNPDSPFDGLLKPQETTPGEPAPLEENPLDDDHPRPIPKFSPPVAGNEGEGILPAGYRAEEKNSGNVLLDQSFVMPRMIEEIPDDGEMQILENQILDKIE